jgi:cell division protein FtsB
VRAYLGYLRNEQEVVDDRNSRREISHTYYLRNTNRIRALRQVAVRIARETRNDYLPEFEAVTRDELGNLFETPPRPESLQTGAVLNNTFRFLGMVRSREIFYVFARLDPYEQAELIRKEQAGVKQSLAVGAAAAAQPAEHPATALSPARTEPANHQSTGRPRRVGP